MSSMQRNHKESIYDLHLGQNQANYSALTPLSFLERTAAIYPERTAIVYGDIRRTWKQTYERCRAMASSLTAQAIEPGDTVSILAANIPEHFEAHFSVPMCGAVLNSINTRLDAETIAFILQHAETKLFIVDPEFVEVASRALQMIDKPPRVVNIEDPLFSNAPLIGDMTYDQLIANGDSNFEACAVENEWGAISLNYTSGTTGNPKGVVYHHRGAYLNAVSNVVSWSMSGQPVYLWTLPMFHCNGWCFPWTMALTGGINVCLRQVRVDAIFDAIRNEKVDHFCGAPIVLNMMNSADEAIKSGVDHEVKVMTAGAPPPASVIQGMEAMGFDVTHVYGLTETYGPCVVCEWQDEWGDSNADAQAKLKARQGVKAPMLEDLKVVDPVSLEEVPSDGVTIGEIFIRGNLVMKGYLKNPSTTDDAFEGGWFHSGDLAVRHPDGYVEIKDRSKDVIISGGENISSIEIEDVLYRHPLVSEAAVVAKSDPKWGETPCAFINARDVISAEEIIEFCRANMAHFKVPKTIVFGELPKTSTGKVQKYLLREKTRHL